MARTPGKGKRELKKIPGNRIQEKERSQNEPPRKSSPKLNKEVGGGNSGDIS